MSREKATDKMDGIKPSVCTLTMYDAGTKPIQFAFLPNTDTSIDIRLEATSTFLNMTVSLADAERIESTLQKAIESAKAKKAKKEHKACGGA